MFLIYFSIIISFLGIAFAWFLAAQIGRSSASVEALAGQAGEGAGAVAFFKKRYKIISVVGIIIFILLLVWPGFGWLPAIGFFLGVLLSGLSEFITATVIKLANEKVIDSSKRGLSYVFDVSFKGGLAAGFITLSLGLLTVAGYYWLFGSSGLIELAFGVSLISVFANFSGNFEDYSGPSADIFETYTITLITAIILGILLFPRSSQFIFLPLLLTSISILTSIIGSFFARLGKSQNTAKAIYKGFAATIILSAAAFYPIVAKLMAGQAISENNLYFSALIGLAVTALIFVTAAYKLKLAIFPILIIGAGMAATYWLAGIYGIALAATAMISVSGITFGFNDHKEVISIYKIIAAVFASVILFFVYLEQVGMRGVSHFTFRNPKVIVGLLLGGILVYLFTSFFMAGDKASKKILSAVLVPLLTPILVGKILGPEALGGLLIGVIAVGLLVIISKKQNENARTAIISLMKGLCIVSVLIVIFLV